MNWRRTADALIEEIGRRKVGLSEAIKPSFSDGANRLNCVSTLDRPRSTTASLAYRSNPSRLHRHFSFVWPVLRNKCRWLSPGWLNQRLLEPIVPQVCVFGHDKLEAGNILLGEF
jgi:hypothetical protein